MRISILLLFICVVGGIVLQSYSGGAPPGYSGSPVDNQTCAQSSCHDGGSPIPVVGWINTSIPSPGYRLDSTYEITVSAVHVGATRFGFCLSPQDLFGNQVGELLSTTGTQLRGAGKYITHIGSSISAIDTNSWVFSWTAPSVPIDSVTFYCSFNAANGDGQTSGDVIFTSSLTCFQFDFTATVEQNIDMESKVFYNSLIQELQISRNMEQDFQVIATNGQIVKQGKVVGNISTADLYQGCYLLHLFNTKEAKQSIYKFVITR